MLQDTNTDSIIPTDTEISTQPLTPGNETLIQANTELGDNTGKYSINLVC